MDLFVGRARRREPCSRCDAREDTALCVCGGYFCCDCLVEAHFNDHDPDLCSVLRQNPDLWVEWDAARYFAEKVDWRTKQ